MHRINTAQRCLRNGGGGPAGPRPAHWRHLGLPQQRQRALHVLPMPPMGLGAAAASSPPGESEQAGPGGPGRAMLRRRCARRAALPAAKRANRAHGAEDYPGGVAGDFSTPQRRNDAAVALVAVVNANPTSITVAARQRKRARVAPGGDDDDDDTETPTSVGHSLPDEDAPGEEGVAAPGRRSR